MNRRDFLAACAGIGPALAASPPERTSLGVVIHSYGMRLAADRARGAGQGIAHPLGFLDYCRSLGAGGVQVEIGVRDTAYATRLREATERAGMYLEGSIRLPRDHTDLDRFAAEVRTASAAGASVLRTVLLSGRRYETFNSAAAFREFAERSWRSLTLAEPIVARHDLKLAVENHKDWRADELVAILKRLDSQHVGTCVDTGNSIALLEDPYEVIEALAPRALAVHLKDMAVAEYADGFLLAEVPLGEGFLDLNRIIRTLRGANSSIRFSLEMITRDPLKVPCLTEKYWATFEDLPGRYLARTLALVRAHASQRPLPMVSGLDPEEKIRIEDENVRRCLDFAKTRLGL
ncbi:MAG: sugar phosphate isomerase/epimerase [Isosphaeraceae bacterium]|nr:sugar phosphate isomerase/epimerase [Isosphaeraceae bacterium]